MTQDYYNYCQSTGRCPICLSENTKISTPKGEVNIQGLKIGDSVYSLNSKGEKTTVSILRLAKTYVGKNHKILSVELVDGRRLSVSPGHPTADGRDVATLKAGDVLDGSKISSITSSVYKYDYTYDLLPDSQTGAYYANGILMGSTLKR